MKFKDRYHSVAMDKDVYELFEEWCKINNYGNPKKKIQEIITGVATGKLTVNYNVIKGS